MFQAGQSRQTSAQYQWRIRAVFHRLRQRPRPFRRTLCAADFIRDVDGIRAQFQRGLQKCPLAFRDEFLFRGGFRKLSAA